MNSGGHQSDLFPFRFNLGLMLGSGLASGRVSRHESAASTGVNPDPYTIAVTVSLLRYLLDKRSRSFSWIPNLSSYVAYKQFLYVIKVDEDDAKKRSSVDA
ncbi:hypothetical protein HanXRQr2_Chr17g0810291 [Helianthus annuus]|uniref:Uncharacterized protein n=1 Tax=Helianthus annuus TaxID=4232 RepID=A0A251RSD6_HELAN|nr:hypothetical protein HanXRQr2_Chr17g0810291 [Helianthus annuus]KAJ0959131.1 hypothetical protein HanPSC8_Chr00c457g0808651 [Helianthus annuus]